MGEGGFGDGIAMGEEALATVLLLEMEALPTVYSYGRWRPWRQYIAIYMGDGSLGDNGGASLCMSVVFVRKNLRMISPLLMATFGKLLPLVMEGCWRS